MVKESMAEEKEDLGKDNMEAKDTRRTKEESSEVEKEKDLERKEVARYFMGNVTSVD